MKKKKLLVFGLVVILTTGVLAEQIIERKVSLGGMLTSGNSELRSLHFDFSMNRNWKWIDDVSLKGSFDHESSSGIETMFKIYSSLRYAFSAGKRFYSFGKVEAEHDRFQDINLRLIPTLGMGYWIADDGDYKLMGEGALGFQRNYLVNQSASEIVVLKLSSYLYLFGFTNQFDCYTQADDFYNYRVINESIYNIKLNSFYSFKLALKDEYNNRPASGVQKNDLRFTVGLEYSFKKVL